MTRLTALLLLSFACAPAAALAGSLRCPGCNVIVVTIDVLRADELKAPGSPHEVMPYLDSLAAGGADFVDAYSPSADTLPADISLMSGLYSWNHGARLPLRDDAGRKRWAASDRSLPGILKRRGYAVYGLNLQEVWADKELPVGGPPPPGALGGGGRFFLLLRATVHDPYFPSREDAAAVAPEIADDAPSRADVLRCAVASLAAKDPPESLRFDKKPTDFFSVSDEDRKAIDTIVEEPDPGRRLDEVRLFDPSVALYPLISQCFWSFFSSSTIAGARALYDAKARGVDEMLQGLMERPRMRGLLKDSIVVITSQHGEEFLEHGRVAHSDQLYDETVRVPLILLLPGLKSGVVVKGTASAVDVLPTVLQALGIPAPSPLDGESLLPCVPRGCRGRRAFSEWNGAAALRDDRYLYLRAPRGAGPAGERLFDRQEDPKELVDVAGRRPAQTTRLRALLLKTVGERLERSGGEWPSWADERMREQVISTGYW